MKPKSWFDLHETTQRDFLVEFRASLQAIVYAGIVTVNRELSFEDFQTCVTPFAIRAAEGVMNARKRGARVRRAKPKLTGMGGTGQVLGEYLSQFPGF